MVTRDDIKKAVKKLLPARFTWINPYQKIKESHDFNIDLYVSDEALETLKYPIREIFMVEVKKKGLRNCLDVEDLIDLIWRKVQAGIQQNQQQSNNNFIELLFSMAAKMAKADGVVSREEVDLIEQLIANTFKMTPADRSFAINCWNKAKNSSDSFEQYANLFFQSSGSDSDLLLNTLHLLFELAASDNRLHSEEERMLRYAVSKFGFTNETFASLKEHFFPDTSKYYHALGCKKTDSNEVIRNAYRNLVAELHPDKFVSKQLPKEMLDFAQKRSQEINEAWQMIKRERGFS